MKKNLSAKNILKGTPIQIKSLKSPQKLISTSVQPIQNQSNVQSLKNQIEDVNKILKNQIKQRQFQFKELYQMIIEIKKIKKQKSKNQINKSVKTIQTAQEIHFPLTHLQTENQNISLTQNKIKNKQKSKNCQSSINIQNSLIKNIDCSSINNLDSRILRNIQGSKAKNIENLSIKNLQDSTLINSNNPSTVQNWNNIESIKKQKRKSRCGTITSYKQLPFPSSPCNQSSKCDILNQEDIKYEQSYLQTTSSQFYRSGQFQNNDILKASTSKQFITNESFLKNMNSPKNVVSPTKSFKSQVIQMQQSGFDRQSFDKINLRLNYLQNKLKSFQSSQKYNEQKVQNCIIKHYHLNQHTSKISQDHNNLAQQIKSLNQKIASIQKNVDQFYQISNRQSLKVQKLQANSLLSQQTMKNIIQSTNTIKLITNDMTLTINNHTENANNMIQTVHHIKQILKNQNEKNQSLENALNQYKRNSKNQFERINKEIDSFNSKIQDIKNNDAPFKQFLQNYTEKLQKKICQQSQKVQNKLKQEFFNQNKENTSNIQSNHKILVQLKQQINMMNTRVNQISKTQSAFFKENHQESNISINFENKNYNFQKIDEIQNRINGTQQIVSELMKVSMMLTNKINSLCYSKSKSQRPNQKKIQSKQRKGLSQQFWLLKQQLNTIDENSKESSLELGDQSLSQKDNKDSFILQSQNNMEESIIYKLQINQQNSISEIDPNMDSFLKSQDIQI